MVVETLGGVLKVCEKTVYDIQKKKWAPGEFGSDAISAFQRHTTSLPLSIIQGVVSEMFCPFYLLGW